MSQNGGTDEQENGNRRNRSPSPPVLCSHSVLLRWLAWLAVALIVAWLLSMTLRPGGQPKGINLIPFHEKRPAVACLLHNCRWAHSAARFLFMDVLGNLAVFVPLGAALAVATFPPHAEGRTVRNFGSRSWFRIVTAGFLFSLGIELAQLLIPSRATDVDDVILNTLGTAVGAMIVWGLRRLMRDQKR